MIPALKKTNNSSVGIEELKDGVYNEAESHESAELLPLAKPGQLAEPEKAMQTTGGGKR